MARCTMPPARACSSGVVGAPPWSCKPRRPSAVWRVWPWWPAAHHGHHTTLPALRRRFSLSLKGITATRLIEMADTLGLQCRPLRLEMDELAQLQTPCILHWDLDHFVVLREVRKQHVVILDPAQGERRLSHAECGRHFTGIALELSKGPTFQRQRPEPPVSLRTLAGSVQGLGRSLTQIFGLALVLELFAISLAVFLCALPAIGKGAHNIVQNLGSALRHGDISAVRSIEQHIQANEVIKSMDHAQLTYNMKELLKLAKQCEREALAKNAIGAALRCNIVARGAALNGLGDANEYFALGIWAKQHMFPAIEAKTAKKAMFGDALDNVDLSKLASSTRPPTETWISEIESLRVVNKNARLSIHAPPQIQISINNINLIP